PLVLVHVLGAVDLLDRVARLDRAAERVDRVGRICGDAAAMQDVDRELDLARRRRAPRIDREPQRRGHGRKPLPITYCSIEICRLDSGLAVFWTANRARTASVSRLKSGPWNSLPTTLPPGASTAIPISSARSNSVSERA